MGIRAKLRREIVPSAPMGEPLRRMAVAAVFNICHMAFLIGPLWFSVAVTAAARADTTVLVGTAGAADSTLTGAIKSFAVTNSGSTWTQSDFNSDSWSQTTLGGANGLAQDIYGNVYTAVNTGDNATRGIRIYRQTGGASVGSLTGSWGSGNLTGNGADGLAIGADGRLYAGIAFGTGNNKLLSFDTTALSSGQIQTGQGGSDTGLTGLNTPRGITVASDGNFYLANRGTGQILRWTGSGTTAAVVATNNTASMNYQGVSWDAANNRLLTRSINTSNQNGLTGSLTLAGSGSDASIRAAANNTASTGVAAVEGSVAFTNYGAPPTSNGVLATAVTGNTATQTNRATSLVGPLYMLVLRDTRLWEGATGSWTTAANWRQGIGGTTGAATFTSGSGATSLPSVLTFTGTAGGTVTNDVAGTVNVGGLNFAPGAGAYTLAGSGFTLAPNANIRNLSTNQQTISADIVLGSSQWIQSDAGSTLTISGNVSGSGFGLTKTGLGTLLLTGSNSSYSGATVVGAGGLLVDGQLSSSNITVNSGGLLGGSGSMGGLLAFGDGALLAFDASSAGLQLAGADNVSFVNAAAFGVASLRTRFGAGIDWSGIADGTYTLLANTTTNFSGIGNFGQANAYDLGGGRSAYFQNGSLKLVVVPEPGAIALAGIGIAVAGWVLRRARGNAALFTVR